MYPQFRKGLPVPKTGSTTKVPPAAGNIEPTASAGHPPVTSRSERAGVTTQLSWLRCSQYSRAGHRITSFSRSCDGTFRLCVISQTPIIDGWSPRSTAVSVMIAMPLSPHSGFSCLCYERLHTFLLQILPSVAFSAVICTTKCLSALTLHWQNCL
jgi:hypothetical protein